MKNKIEIILADALDRASDSGDVIFRIRDSAEMLGGVWSETRDDEFLVRTLSLDGIELITRSWAISDGGTAYGSYYTSLLTGDSYLD